MATKYWKRTFKGALSDADIHREMAAAPGVIVRVDTAAEETTVYFAGEEAAARPSLERSGHGLTEVRAEEVTATRTSPSTGR
jgi:hypothetical protein